MKNIKSIYLSLIIASIISIGSLSGCEKFLDAKPVKSLQIPETLPDMQALLDNFYQINTVDPSSKEISADDYYLTDASYSRNTEYERRMYTWEQAFVFAPTSNDWSIIYKMVFRANSILENVEKVQITDANIAEWQNVKGQAAFLRGKSFLEALQIWSLAYDESSSPTDQGIPLRLNSNFNESSKRSTVKESYDQVLADLTLAAKLLPKANLHPMRASKSAAYALLSRTYLNMRDYKKAGLYADSCLAINSALLDFNILSTTAAYPIPQFNSEVIYESSIFLPAMLSADFALIVPELYAQYEANDLRRTLFFQGSTSTGYAFRGSYEKADQLFSGLAVDEILLIRAECRARAGDLTSANSDLNALLRKRYKTGLYSDLTINNEVQLTDRIILERRKELLMRGIRWQDIKRLNKEGRNISLKRTVAGVNHTLAPNARRFALPLPDDIVNTWHISQNTY